MIRSNYESFISGMNKNHILINYIDLNFKYLIIKYSSIKSRHIELLNI